MRKVYVYDSVWKIPMKIYAIGDKPLPKPVSLIGILFGLVTGILELFFILGTPLGKIMIKHSIFQMLFLALPIASYLYLPNLNIDGKHVFRFIYDYLQYMFKPKVFANMHVYKKKTVYFSNMGDLKLQQKGGSKKNKPKKNERSELDGISNS